MTTPRITWIDVARGLGIFIVIYAHTLPADSLRYIFYSFHMPLFFFLSGIVFHHKKNETFLPMVKKNIRKMLIPYFIFALISYLLWYVTLASWHPNMETLSKHLVGILYGNNAENIMFYNGVLWFLPCLFITKVMFSGFTELSTRKRFLLLLLFFFSVLGYLFSKFFPKEHLLFGLETALTAIVFFGFGYIWHTQAERLNTFFRKHAYILFPTFAFLCIFLATVQFILYGHQIDLRLGHLGNYYLFYGASMSGILSTLALSKAINTNKILEYMGRKSLILFVWHLLIFSYLNTYILPNLPTSLIASLKGPLLSLITAIFAITVILIVDLVYRKLTMRLQKP